tara:strand:- start:381 stop:557 length:177 start_codon:yes stop_codon:yes gene_type:complete
MSFCFICKELEEEDELCKNYKCIYVKHKIKTMGITQIYDILIALRYVPGAFKIITTKY